MDYIEVLIGLGLLMVGVMIGYPLGHIFAKREERQRVQQRAYADILSAEVIE